MSNGKDIKLNKEVIHGWTVLCSGSSVDEMSNNISLFNLIENLKFDLALGEPQEKERKEKGWYSVPFNFWLITRLQKPNIDSNLTFDVGFQVIDPKGKQVGKGFGSTIKFGVGMDSLRLRNQIGLFPITESGVYRITVSISEVGMEKYSKIGETNFKIDANIKKS